MPDNSFGVLLVRKIGHAIDATLAYRNDRLPELGDEIELSGAIGSPVLAKVTGIEKAKSLPIRATEL